MHALVVPQRHSTLLTVCARRAVPAGRGQHCHVRCCRWGVVQTNGSHWLLALNRVHLASPGVLASRQYSTGCAAGRRGLLLHAPTRTGTLMRPPLVASRRAPARRALLLQQLRQARPAPRPCAVTPCCAALAAPRRRAPAPAAPAAPCWPPPRGASQLPCALPLRPGGLLAAPPAQLGLQPHEQVCRRGSSMGVQSSRSQASAAGRQLHLPTACYPARALAACRMCRPVLRPARTLLAVLHRHGRGHRLRQLQQRAIHLRAHVAAVHQRTQHQRAQHTQPAQASH